MVGGQGEGCNKPAKEAEVEDALDKLQCNQCVHMEYYNVMFEKVFNMNYSVPEELQRC